MSRREPGLGSPSTDVAARAKQALEAYLEETSKTELKLRPRSSVPLRICQDRRRRGRVWLACFVLSAALLAIAIAAWFEQEANHAATQSKSASVQSSFPSKPWVGAHPGTTQPRPPDVKATSILNFTSSGLGENQDASLVDITAGTVASLSIDDSLVQTPIPADSDRQHVSSGVAVVSFGDAAASSGEPAPLSHAINEQSELHTAGSLYSSSVRNDVSVGAIKFDDSGVDAPSASHSNASPQVAGTNFELSISGASVDASLHTDEYAVNIVQNGNGQVLSSSVAPLAKTDGSLKQGVDVVSVCVGEFANSSVLVGKFTSLSPISGSTGGGVLGPYASDQSFTAGTTSRHEIFDDGTICRGKNHTAESNTQSQVISGSRAVNHVLAPAATGMPESAPAASGVLSAVLSFLGLHSKASAHSAINDSSSAFGPILASGQEEPTSISPELDVTLVNTSATSFQAEINSSAEQVVDPGSFSNVVESSASLVSAAAEDGGVALFLDGNDVTSAVYSNAESLPASERQSEPIQPLLPGKEQVMVSELRTLDGLDSSSPAAKQFNMHETLRDDAGQHEDEHRIGSSAAINAAKNASHMVFPGGWFWSAQAGALWSQLSTSSTYGMFHNGEDATIQGLKQQLRRLQASMQQVMEWGARVRHEAGQSAGHAEAVDGMNVPVGSLQEGLGQLQAQGLWTGQGLLLLIAVFLFFWARSQQQAVQRAVEKLTRSEGKRREGEQVQEQLRQKLMRLTIRMEGNKGDTDNMDKLQAENGEFRRLTLSLMDENKLLKVELAKQEAGHQEALGTIEDLQSQASDLEVHTQELVNQLKQQQFELQTVQDQRKQLQDELKSKKVLIDSLQESLMVNGDDNSALSHRNAYLEVQNVELEEQVEAIKSELLAVKNHLVHSVEIGKSLQTGVSMLLQLNPRDQQATTVIEKLRGELRSMKDTCVKQQEELRVHKELLEQKEGELAVACMRADEKEKELFFTACERKGLKDELEGKIMQHQMLKKQLEDKDAIIRDLNSQLSGPTFFTPRHSGGLRRSVQQSLSMSLRRDQSGTPNKPAWHKDNSPTSSEPHTPKSIADTPQNPTISPPSAPGSDEHPGKNGHDPTPTPRHRAPRDFADPPPTPRDRSGKQQPWNAGKEASSRDTAVGGEGSECSFNKVKGKLDLDKDLPEKMSLAEVHLRISNQPTLSSYAAINAPAPMRIDTPANSTPPSPFETPYHTPLLQLPAESPNATTPATPAPNHADNTSRQLQMADDGGHGMAAPRPNSADNHAATVESANCDEETSSTMPPSPFATHAQHMTSMSQPSADHERAEGQREGEEVRSHPLRNVPGASTVSEQAKSDQADSSSQGAMPAPIFVGENPSTARLAGSSSKPETPSSKAECGKGKARVKDQEGCSNVDCAPGLAIVQVDSLKYVPNLEQAGDAPSPSSTARRSADQSGAAGNHSARNTAASRHGSISATAAQVQNDAKTLQTSPDRYKDDSAATGSGSARTPKPNKTHPEYSNLLYHQPAVQPQLAGHLPLSTEHTVALSATSAVSIAKDSPPATPSLPLCTAASGSHPTPCASPMAHDPHLPTPDDIPTLSINHSFASSNSSCQSAPFTPVASLCAPGTGSPWQKSSRQSPADASSTFKPHLFPPNDASNSQSSCSTAPTLVASLCGSGTGCALVLDQLLLAASNSAGPSLPEKETDDTAASSTGVTLDAGTFDATSSASFNPTLSESNKDGANLTSPLRPAPTTNLDDPALIQCPSPTCDLTTTNTHHSSPVGNLPSTVAPGTGATPTPANSRASSDSTASLQPLRIVPRLQLSCILKQQDQPQAVVFATTPSCASSYTPSPFGSWRGSASTSCPCTPTLTSTPKGTAVDTEPASSRTPHPRALFHPDRRPVLRSDPTDNDILAPSSDPHLRTKVHQENGTLSMHAESSHHGVTPVGNVVTNNCYASLTDHINPKEPSEGLLHAGLLHFTAPLSDRSVCTPRRRFLLASRSTKSASNTPRSISPMDQLDTRTSPPCKANPSLLNPHHSPRPSPRTSPRASPRASMSGSKRVASSNSIEHDSPDRDEVTSQALLSPRNMFLSFSPRSNVSPNAKLSPRPSMSPSTKLSPRSNIIPNSHPSPHANVSPHTKVSPLSYVSPPSNLSPKFSLYWTAPEFGLRAIISPEPDPLTAPLIRSSSCPTSVNTSPSNPTTQPLKPSPSALPAVMKRQPVLPRSADAAGTGLVRLEVDTSSPPNTFPVNLETAFLRPTPATPAPHCLPTPTTPNPKHFDPYHHPAPLSPLQSTPPHPTRSSLPSNPASPYPFLMLPIEKLQNHTTYSPLLLSRPSPLEPNNSPCASSPDSVNETLHAPAPTQSASPNPPVFQRRSRRSSCVPTPLSSRSATSHPSHDQPISQRSKTHQTSRDHDNRPPSAHSSAGSHNSHQPSNSIAPTSPVPSRTTSNPSPLALHSCPPSPHPDTSSTSGPYGHEHDTDAKTLCPSDIPTPAISRASTPNTTTRSSSSYPSTPGNLDDLDRIPFSSPPSRPRTLSLNQHRAAALALLGASPSAVNGSIDGASSAAATPPGKALSDLSAVSSLGSCQASPSPCTSRTHITWNPLVAESMEIPPGSFLWEPAESEQTARL